MSLVDMHNTRLWKGVHRAPGSQGIYISVHGHERLLQKGSLKNFPSCTVPGEEKFTVASSFAFIFYVLLFSKPSSEDLSIMNTH